MKEKALKIFYERYAPEQTYEYLRRDPVYQQKEKELKDAVSALEPVIKALGRETWLKFDRILTAHNNCEAYALQKIHLKGVDDALRVYDVLLEEENNGRN